MKNAIRTLLKLLIRYIFKLYSYKTKMRFQSYKTAIYSFWIRNAFGKCGKDVYIQSPAFIKGGKYISIGNGFGSLERLRLECWDSYGEYKYSPNLIIGNNVIMNYNVHIGCIDKVSIGNNVLFASNIFISDHQHGYVDPRDVGIAPSKRSLNTKGPVIIKDNVWIGENVVIVPNVTIGEGCIIGANSVVTKSFPKNSVLAGVPAKFIKSLDI